MLLSVGEITAQTNYNINLVGQWNGAPNSDTTTLFKQKYSEMWGYVAPDNKEYALLGGVSGYYFINVSNPSNPTLSAFVPDTKAPRAINRDLKTYSHYAYLAADNTVPSSFMIADLQYLPDSVHIVYDSDTIFTNAHSMYIEKDRLYTCSTRNASGITNNFLKMAVYSLANPERPQRIGVLNSPDFNHVHQVTVINDTAYCSNGFDGLFVYDYRNAANPIEIARLQAYQFSGYNHSTSFNNNHKKMVFTDEVPHNLPVKIYDISNLSNMTQLSTISSNTSKANKVPHIPYWKDNHVYCSYYTDGLRIFNVSNPSNPVEVGYYDTYLVNDTNAEKSYAGNWGVYPYLPSGTVIAADMQTGLYVFNVSAALSVENAPDIFKDIQVYPNPTRDFVQLQGTNQTPGKVNLTITDMYGKECYQHNLFATSVFSQQINTQLWANGIYILTLTHENGSIYHHKIVKQ